MEYLNVLQRNSYYQHFMLNTPILKHNIFKIQIFTIVYLNADSFLMGGAELNRVYGAELSWAELKGRFFWELNCLA